MITITLKPLFHRNTEVLGIFFAADADINKAIRLIKGIKWSQTFHCWYMPLNIHRYNLLVASVKNLALVNTDELASWLNQGNSRPPLKNETEPKPVPSHSGANQRLGLSEANKAALDNYHAHLILKAYSPSTIRTYKNEFVQLLRLLKQKPVDTLTPNDLKRYMQYILEKENVSENTAHSRLNALKFYFEQVLKREDFFFAIPRPKKRLLLPKLLNEKEIGRLFNALTNRKHKAMLFTAYSAGLRVSEIVNLKIRDIDSGRMQMFIEKAKGKKDRFVNLSPLLLDILRKYMQQAKPRPNKFLFESDITGTAYPIRTVQQIFSNAKQKAGIVKDVGIHSLRHSFATHLLDKGTDIRYIKDLLGHFDIRTTERYLHVSNQQLVNVISPLDDLFSKQTIDW